MRRPVIGVMGASTASATSVAAARELGRMLAERGWIVLTGGRPAGVMAAACAGAKMVPGSLTLGILPTAAGGVGPDVDVAVFTGMGDARNAINVLTSDAVVACGVESSGTLSEIGLALTAAKPVILLNGGSAAGALVRDIADSAARVLEATSPAQVVQLLEQNLGVPRGAPWNSS
jgi:uncharacterized protein (TIGR00725 family)